MGVKRLGSRAKNIMNRVIYHLAKVKQFPYCSRENTEKKVWQHVYFTHQPGDRESGLEMPALR